MVECLVWDQDAAGSSPVTSTNKKVRKKRAFFVARREDLNLKKATSVKKSCRGQVFSKVGAQAGTEAEGLGRPAGKARSDCALSPRPTKKSARSGLFLLPEGRSWSEKSASFQIEKFIKTDSFIIKIFKLGLISS